MGICEDEAKVLQPVRREAHGVAHEFGDIMHVGTLVMSSSGDYRAAKSVFEPSIARDLAVQRVGEDRVGEWQ